MAKIRWGVLGAAKIARTKVIPAMQRAQEGEVTALASRSLETARTSYSPDTRTLSSNATHR